MPAAPGTVLPVGRVVAALSELAGAVLLPVDSAPPIHALAVRDDSGAARLLVANLGTESRQVTVRSGSATLQFGEVSLLTSDTDGGASWAAIEITGGHLELPPSGVARVVIRAG